MSGGDPAQSGPHRGGDGAADFERRLLSPSAAASPSSPNAPPSSAVSSHVLAIRQPLQSQGSLPSVKAREALPCPQARLLHSWWQWPSYFTLSWMTPLLLLGARRTLRFADLWDCYSSEHSEEAWEAFQPHWQSALAEAKRTGAAPRLGKALRAMIGWQFLLANVAYCWVPTDQLLGPQFLNQLVSYRYCSTERPPHLHLRAHPAPPRPVAAPSLSPALSSARVLSLLPRLSVYARRPRALCPCGTDTGGQC